MGWEGIGTLIGKLSTYIPGRIEKLKNEKKELENERRILKEKNCSASASRRIIVIDEQLSKIDTILGNAAKD